MHGPKRLIPGNGATGDQDLQNRLPENVGYAPASCSPDDYLTPQRETSRRATKDLPNPEYSAHIADLARRQLALAERHGQAQIIRFCADVAARDIPGS
jgi:hypothetical protein